MVDVFVYYAKLPRGVREMVTPCLDGYTIYLDERCLNDDALRRKLFDHAIGHIINNDFEKHDVQKIEGEAH